MIYKIRRTIFEPTGNIFHGEALPLTPEFGYLVITDPSEEGGEVGDVALMFSDDSWLLPNGHVHVRNSLSAVQEAVEDASADAAEVLLQQDADEDAARENGDGDDARQDGDEDDEDDEISDAESDDDESSDESDDDRENDDATTT
jgi:hypothetical protein